MEKYNKNIVHVVYAADNNFAPILGVSLISLLENSKDIEKIIVYILDSGIANDNKKRLESICEKYRFNTLKWISAKNVSKELSVEVEVDRGSLSQYSRLFVSSLLPESLNRVLYLDCDVLINHSIRELWNLDLQDKTIAALMDAFSKNYRRNINLNPKDIMFNSGVMLIDLDRWRNLKIEEKLLGFIREKNGKIQQGDQGVLNAILSQDTYCFEPRFNSVTIFYDFSYDEMLRYRKPPEFYCEDLVKDAVNNPSIIHFTSSFLSNRPWIEGCNHKYVNEWLKYKNMSPWSSEPLRAYVRPNGLKGIYIRIMTYMPRKFMIFISGFLQAYGRPFVNLTKNYAVKK